MRLDCLVGTGRWCAVALHTISWLTVLGLGCERSSTTVHGRSSHAGLVAVSTSGVVVASMSGSSFSVTSGLDLAVALPEWSTGRTRGVVVLWGWAESLLLLVMADQQELKSCTDQEEEQSQDGDSEASSVQAADVAPITSTRCCFTAETRADRSVDETTAVVGTITGVIGNGGKATNEADVEEDGDVAKESNTAKAKGEKDAEDGV